jgi:hypothetical protein
MPITTPRREASAMPVIQYSDTTKRSVSIAPRTKRSGNQNGGSKISGNDKIVAADARIAPTMTRRGPKYAMMRGAFNAHRIDPTA